QHSRPSPPRAEKTIQDRSVIAGDRADTDCVVAAPPSVSRPVAPGSRKRGNEENEELTESVRSGAGLVGWRARLGPGPGGRRSGRRGPGGRGPRGGRHDDDGSRGRPPEKSLVVFVSDRRPKGQVQGPILCFAVRPADQ